MHLLEPQQNRKLPAVFSKPQGLKQPQKHQVQWAEEGPKETVVLVL